MKTKKLKADTKQKQISNKSRDKTKIQTKTKNLKQRKETKQKWIEKKNENKTK